MPKYTYDQNNTPYQLRGNKHICPQCGQHTLQLYINVLTGNPINDYVGKCDRLYNCEYDYKPKNFYSDHPDELANLPKSNNFRPIKQTPPPKELVTIDEKYMILSLIYTPIDKPRQCDFVNHLMTMFSPDDVERVCKQYFLGATSQHAVIFWQIDEKGRIHEGKVMAYNFANGKRIKSSWVTGESFWVFSTLQGRGKLPENAESTKILFGQHLLKDVDKNTNVCIVESEKNAIFGALVFPKFTWLAVGSAAEFGKLWTIRKTLKLCRSIVLVPDADAIEDWSEKAKKLNLPNLRVWGICEGHPGGFDLADYIRYYWLTNPQTITPYQGRNARLQETPTPPIKTPSKKLSKADCTNIQLEKMIIKNPAIEQLIETFDLEIVN